MTVYLFGSGTVIGKRVDVANAKPALLGTIQDFEIDFDQSIKTLMGQFKVPVAAGAGELKIACKAKFARIQVATLNNLLLGGTETDNAFLDLTTGETGTVGSGPYTYQTANHATFTEDQGVFYSSNGVQLQPVNPGSEAAGSYSVNTATGVYTFAAADGSKAMLFYYNYTTTTGNQISLANQLSGQQPSFELVARQQFNYLGTQKVMSIKLNACVSSKITFPFKNQDFAVSELDVMVLADASNQVGTISISE